IVVLPAIGLLLFLVSSGQLCINCAKVTGSYTTDIKLDESSLSINVVLKQDQGNIVGQVVVSEQKPPTPSNASRQYLEVIHTGKIRQRTVAFKTYPRSGQTPRFEFTGEAVGEHELKGNLVVNMPEIGCVGRFPVDLK
ncbi:MAG: hypothetical protein JNN15_20065, partial [Blastocatellia bacterium]|nr:hypothetical protein [Blastocatellia bacterium]